MRAGVLAAFADAVLEPAVNTLVALAEGGRVLEFAVGSGRVAVPLLARILAACDVYDALSSARPYKAPWSAADIRAELQAQAGKHFDPELVEVFLSVLDEAQADPV